MIRRRPRENARRAACRLDDENQRIVFFGKEGKERFGIPYKALLVVSPQSRAVTSNTGHVVGAIPVPGAGLLGGFIKEKRRYMLIQFNDPDADASVKNAKRRALSG